MKSTKEGVKPLNVMIPISLHTSIKRLSFDEDKNMSELVREFLVTGIKMKIKKN